MTFPRDALLKCDHFVIYQILVWCISNDIYKQRTLFLASFTESFSKKMQVSIQSMMLKYPAFVTQSFATCAAENTKAKFSPSQMKTYIFFLSWMQQFRLTVEPQGLFGFFLPHFFVFLALSPVQSNSRYGQNMMMMLQR